METLKRHMTIVILSVVSSVLCMEPTVNRLYIVTIHVLTVIKWEKTDCVYCHI